MLNFICVTGVDSKALLLLWVHFVDYLVALRIYWQSSGINLAALISWRGFAKLSKGGSFPVTAIGASGCQ